ncbi:MAG TPA: flavodoxin family protein [Rhodocyclaceae bacterium]|nr:flavodoxin family protein [Rhodocyclaceae bacterium]
MAGKARDARKGQAPGKLERRVFRERFLQSFDDPAFEVAIKSLNQVEEIAWQAYSDSRKAPTTQKAGKGFADPNYELSVEWLETSQRLKECAARQKDPASPTRILLISGAARNDGSCPGEISKTYRLSNLAKEVFLEAGHEVDHLDLSLLTSEYGRRIHPCKGCVSTAMPLCHWPCSCYPNHALNQVDDWMAEIYEKWTSAHAVMIVTPVYWYQAPSVLKLMIDRLVCADGGNPDPTSTSGKDVLKAKELELAGWPYQQHLAGRAYGLVVHGDVAGVEGLRRDLSDWLDWMGLINAGVGACVARYIGYYEPYAKSHEALDADAAIQEETRHVAQAISASVGALRKGGFLPVPDKRDQVRPK